MCSLFIDGASDAQQTSKPSKSGEQGQFKCKDPDCDKHFKIVSIW